MRGAIRKTVVVIAVCASAPAIAQMDLSGIRIVEPAPELPGDRAMNCAQITAEMGEIMNKRDMKRGLASSKSKICGATKVLNKQSEERQALSATHMLGVMNDPRLMRLGILAQSKQCAESMAPKQQEQAAAQGDGCETSAPETPAGAADPFVQRGSQTAKPVAQDPFAKR